MAKVHQHHRQGLAGQYCGPDRYHEWPIQTYGNWTDDKLGPWLVPEYMSGSDYSGSLVERSNRDAWREAFPDGEDDWWVEVTGGHGTFAVVVIHGNMPDEALEFLCALSDYPLADEDLHSKLEHEAEGEAWEGWAARDFELALAEMLPEGTEFDPDPDALFALFDECRDRANVYWVNEQGDSMWIDVKRVAAKATVEEIGNVQRSAN